jgi:hypothetical protein
MKTIEKRALKISIRKAVKELVKTTNMTTSQIAQKVASEYNVKKGMVKNFGKFNR